MWPEWIKGLLAVPFVLHSQPTGVFESRSHTVPEMAVLAHRRYVEIMQDVEDMIDDHSKTSSLILFYSSSDPFSSCPSESWTARSIQAQASRTQYWNVLHTTSACRRIQIPGQETLHLISAVCAAIFQ